MAKLRVIVVGAGVFGAWAAWHLRQQGAETTLIDAWGPANSRSSSGDESRIIRGGYGNQPHYVELTDRSFGLWENLETDGGQPILQRTGVLWLFDDNDAYVRECRPHLRRWNFPVEQLDLAQAPARFPQINWSGVRIAYLEQRAGWLYARRSVQAVATRFQQAGGTLLTAQSVPHYSSDGHRLVGIRLDDGLILSADRYVFACGPWLGRIFPEWIGPWLRPTRQEVFYFGTPPGDPRLADPAMPAWLDNAHGSWYGIPGNEQRGFKISCNDLGEVVDPTTVDRTPDPGRLARAREHLAFRFPSLAGAPLLESRVCQYETTPDRNLIIDVLPGDSRALIIGGGSGHGFKMGPAIGELAAKITLGETPVPGLFQVSRFGKSAASS